MVMATKKRPISDQRTLLVMQMLFDDPNSGVDNITQFSKLLGLQQQNISKIVKGQTSFTGNAIYKMCKKFGVSMDWIYGFSEEMYRANYSRSVLQQFRAVAKLVEAELAAKG